MRQVPLGKYPSQVRTSLLLCRSPPSSRCSSVCGCGLALLLLLSLYPGRPQYPCLRAPGCRALISVT